MKDDFKEIKTDEDDDVLEDDSKEVDADVTGTDEEPAAEESSEEDIESEDNSEEEEESTENEEPAIEQEYDGGYKIGYYKVLLSNTDVSENPAGTEVTRLEESFFDDVDESFGNEFLDELENSELDIIDQEEMESDEEFREAFMINQVLENTLIIYSRTINPYSAILSIGEILERYGLILPEFDLDSSVDEWIYDIQLLDDEKEREWFLHLEILQNDDDSFAVFAGVVPN